MSDLSLDSAPPVQSQDNAAFSIWADRVLAIRKHWYLVVVAVILGLGAALVYLSYATRYYRAQATLIITRPSTAGGTNSADVQELYRTELLRTQIETVRDPDTLDRAYQQLNLLLAAQGKTPAEIESVLPSLGWSSNLDVSSIQNSLMFRIVYDHPDKDVAGMVVGEVVNAFATKERNNRKESVERSTEAQRAARDSAKKEYDDASKALLDFQEKYRLVDLDISNSIVRREYADMATRRNGLLAQIDQLQPNHEQCQLITHSELSDEEKINRFSLLDFTGMDTSVRQIELSLLTEQTALEQLTFDNGPRHWLVSLQQGKVASLNRMRLLEYLRMASRVESNWSALNDLLKRTEKELEALLNQSLEYQTAIIQFQNMKADLDSKNEYYSRMKDQLAGLENQMANDTQTISQKDSLYKFPEAVRPRPALTLAMSILVSLVLGVLAALAVESLDDSIKHPEELTRRTGFTFLGLIPHVPEQYQAGDKVNYITKFPQTTFSESFRSLRVNLVITLNARDLSHGVLAVTSSVPKEGKSLVTSNLAASFVQSGKRTLLLQADLRRPTPARLYGLDPEKIANLGTTAALLGQTPYEKCVHQIHENLYLMPCGTCPTNPSELIGSNFKALVDWARTQFDMVIIDTPPLVNVSDTLLITPMCDGVLMVIHGGSTSARLVRTTQDMLTRSNALVLGAVLNDVSSAVERHHRFAERYGFGTYSYYSNYYNKYGYSSHEVNYNANASSGSNKAMD